MFHVRAKQFLMVLSGHKYLGGRDTSKSGERKWKGSKSKDPVEEKDKLKMKKSKKT